MGLLAHRSTRKRISRFWQWWAAHRDDVLAAAAMAEPGFARLGDLLDPAVSALGKHVAWEFGAGQAKPWQLCLSPGTRELLPLTVAWADAAPDDDAVEFLPAKPPRPDAVEAELHLPSGIESTSPICGAP